MFKQVGQRQSQTDGCFHGGWTFGREEIGNGAAFLILLDRKYRTDLDSLLEG